RLEQAVARMEHRARVPQRRLDPLRVEAILVKRLELDPQLVSLLLVGGQAQAARAAKGVPGERLDPVDPLLGAPPVRVRLLAPDRLGSDVVRSCGAAQGEAAVSPARAAGDLAGLVQAHPQPGLGQSERAGAAG